MKYLVTILFSLTFLFNAFSQNNCERNLNDARTDYATGNLYAIPGKLTDCLEEGFTETEKIAAYQLLALTYININQQDKAKESLIKLLTIKTDYQVIKNVDPDELYSLYTQIETDPIYYIGGFTGANYTFAILPDSTFRRTKNSIRGNDDYSYTPALSLKAGVQFIYPLTNSFYLGSTLAFDVQKYDYRQTSGQNFNNENITTSRYSASTSGLDLKVNFRYMKDNYLWKPFVELGISNRLHLRTRIRDYVDDNIQTPQPNEEESINVNDYRRPFNFGLNFQFGTMKKFNENYWEFSLGATYLFIPEIKYDRNGLGGYYETVGNFGQVVEDDYTKLILSFDIKFNIPFYNFK